ncbi:dihydrolipoyl dehydrogenase [Desulfogranum mediterraneum]|uniref:dihydrolipoyl dehydrogenase n=1 Tax=Desulfogranum mediterraneum TaxID=160661 RepID=UPI0003FC27E3|nr:dihydrolipoyl dehydrogenase [Desulfogranum mediterraneum]
MQHTHRYDLVVVGGGPGGYTAAFRAADLGLSVCLVEQHARLGGVCLNVGCIPSKTLLHGATIIEEAEEAAAMGIGFAAPRIDLAALRAHKEGVVAKLTSGLDSLAKARKVSRLQGRASFGDAHTLRVRSDAGEEAVSFEHCILATGSRTSRLPGCPDDPRIWSSSDALALKTVPKRLLIIGGGIIGLEMAQVYHALGAEITIVEMLEQIIPPADKDLVQPLFLKLKKRYQILTRTRVEEITAQAQGIRVRFAGPKAPEEGEYDAVLTAVGRRANSQELGLESIGLEVDGQGCIPVDRYQRSAIPHIYAIGDLVGEPMLAHKATHQGKVAAEVIAGLGSAFSPMTIPSVAYTHPEVAWMGLNEKEAKEQGIDYSKGKFPWGASGRALSSGASAGVSKVLFAKESGRIIGAGICGLNAGELIHEAVLALEMGADAEDISRTVHAHPTLAETFALAAEMVEGSITDLMPPKKR